MMCAGSAISVARPCAKSVSRIDSALRSRSSWAVSSSPVASGTGGVPWPVGGPVGIQPPLFGPRRRHPAEHVDGGRVVRRLRADEDLFGANGPAALAPALARGAMDPVTQAEDAVHESLRTRRAARNVDVDRHELVGGHEGVIVEDAHR